VGLSPITVKILITPLRMGLLFGNSCREVEKALDKEYRIADFSFILSWP
jgi:hypothetical protein